jgi:hypothetical protein
MLTFDPCCREYFQVVKGTGRTKADIDAALTAMLKRQDLPGG